MRGPMPLGSAPSEAIACIPDLSRGRICNGRSPRHIGRRKRRCKMPLFSSSGWCHDKGELLLVYEYLPGSSFDRLLFPKEQGSQHVVVSWENRMKAVAGVTAGVAFLHYECEQRIVHRGIKASNVMLDAMFNAKLGDFGLARYLNQSEINPKAAAAAGTLGYLAPELLRSGFDTWILEIRGAGLGSREGPAPIKDSEHENRSASTLIGPFRVINFGQPVGQMRNATWQLHLQHAYVKKIV